MSTRLSLPSLAILVTALALVLGAVAPAVARHDEERSERPRAASRGTLAIYHGPIMVTLVDEGSDGHQLGDLRVTSAVITNHDGEPTGRLDATLVTTAVNVPGPGDEIRMSELVFSFGEAGSTQVVIGGSAIYPGQGSTLEVGSTTSLGTP